MKSIRQTKDGAWKGYRGARVVIEFSKGGYDPSFTAEECARAWLSGAPCGHPSCFGYYSGDTDNVCSVCCERHVR